MTPKPFISLLTGAVLLCACVSQSGISPASATEDTDCKARLAVARELAELHQYGGDLEAHIAGLARQGASPKAVADYRSMARQIEKVPTLAGDGGREAGIALTLAELNLNCSP